MTAIQRCIRTAQRRMWLNTWVDRLARCTAFAAFLFAVFVLVTRLYDLRAPVLVVGVVLACVALLTSLVWAMVGRADKATAAASLDEAAGLRERVSSGHFCESSDDPFAMAVVADAEKVSSSISVRQHIRFSLPRALPFTAGSLGLAALMFLVTPGLLKSRAAEETTVDPVVLRETKAAVKRKIDAVRKMAETNPALAEVKEELDSLDKWAGGSRQKPTDIRHDATKKIDKLADAVKKKRMDAKYGKTTAMRKMLRGLKVPPTAQTPTESLTKALAKGDFRSAREEIKKLRETLATLKTDEDKEMVAKLSKQLAELSKQLDGLSKNKKLAQKLEQAGLKKEDVERLLKNLKKKDLEQAMKQMEKSGMSQKQIQKLAQQLQQQQQAGSAAKNLSKAASKTASAMNAGQMGEAMAGLKSADGQLSELEQLDQEMAQLDAAAAGLQNAKNDIDKPCSKCSGSGKGCSACSGSGSRKNGGGQGKKGRGRGGLAEEEVTDVGFKTEKGKVHTGEGAIIGQLLFDGPQVKGEVGSSLAEMIEAGERDATDQISRDRIPRQYQAAVKAYFSQVKKRSEETKSGNTPEASDD